MSTELPPVAPSTRPDAAPKPSVDEAKRRLLDEFRSVDLLNPLREHPFVVVGAAVTAGAVLGSSGRVVSQLTALTSGLVRLVKPLSGIVAQVLAAKVAAETVKPDSSETTPPPAEETYAAAHDISP